jgi:hypothetical protein
MDILDVITDYFGVGGLFNPELMEPSEYWMTLRHAGSVNDAHRLN